MSKQVERKIPINDPPAAVAAETIAVGATVGNVARRATKTRYMVLFILCLLYLISYLDRTAISVTAPEMIKEFGFSKTQMGVIFAAFFIPYGTLQIVGGLLGDYYGPRRVLTLLMAWWSIFTVVTGMAWNLVSMFIIRVLFGLGEAGGFPAATRAMATWFRPEDRGNLQGITHAASRLGAAVAPPVAVFLMLTFGWRSVFYILGFLGILWAILFYFYYRDNPKDHWGVNDAELDLITANKEEVHTAKKDKKKIPWGAILKNRHIWALTFADFCYGYTLWVYLTWLPSYLVQSRGFSILKMGFYAALPLLGAMLGDIVGGLLSDHLFRKTSNLKLARCYVIFAAFVGAVVFTLLGVYNDSALAAVFLLTAAMFFLECSNANLWAIAMDLGGDHFAGTVSGFMNTGQGVAGMISPIAFGFIVDVTGSWTFPFFFSTAILMVGAFAILTIDPSKSVKPLDEAGPMEDLLLE
ncbi:MAG: MFS transporter [Desulfobaccales bacterium]